MEHPVQPQGEVVKTAGQFLWQSYCAQFWPYQGLVTWDEMNQATRDKWDLVAVNFYIDVEEKAFINYARASRPVEVLEEQSRQPTGGAPVIKVPLPDKDVNESLKHLPPDTKWRDKKKP